MSTQTIFTLAIIAVVITAFFLGREVYRRSMRVRQRLQMGQIFTNITHELLTPLTVISASIDQLREEEPIRLKIQPAMRFCGFPEISRVTRDDIFTKGS